MPKVSMKIFLNTDKPDEFKAGIVEICERLTNEVPLIKGTLSIPGVLYSLAFLQEGKEEEFLLQEEIQYGKSNLSS